MAGFHLLRAYFQGFDVGVNVIKAANNQFYLLTRNVLELNIREQVHDPFGDPGAALHDLFEDQLLERVQLLITASEAGELAFELFQKFRLLLV